MIKLAIILLSGILGTYTLARADSVYKWRDENGKWHFSDKAPAHQKAEEQQIEFTNTSESSKTTQQLKKVFPDELPEEAAYRQRKLEEQRQHQARIDAWCKKARRRLDIIRGKVVFLDNNGNQIHVTEEERAVREQELAKRISASCH